MVHSKQQVFCSCCTLRTGSTIIGTLGWLLSLIIVRLLFSKIPFNYKKDQYGDNTTDVVNEIGYSVSSLIVNIFMLWGVNKNIRKYIMPWLVLKCVECILLTMITLLTFIIFFFEDCPLNIIFKLFFFLFGTTLCWYFWYCIWSLYMQMKEEIPETMIPMSHTMVVEDITNMDEKKQYPIDAV